MLKGWECLCSLEIRLLLSQSVERRVPGSVVGTLQGNVGGCGSTQKGHYHMHTHTAEVRSKKAFWSAWSELSPKIGESYPWCPVSGSGDIQHALEETGLRR